MVALQDAMESEISNLCPTFCRLRMGYWRAYLWNMHAINRISERIARLLEREGYLERDCENGSLVLDSFDADVINELQGSSITYRIAVGSQRDKKVFTLKTCPVRNDEVDNIKGQVLAKAGGFSLHAGVFAKAYQRDKVERLCRYIARPAVSIHRLERLPDGRISYELKTPYKNGTTHMDEYKSHMKTR